MSIGLRFHDSADGTLSQRAAAISAQGFGCVHIALSKALGAEFMQPAALTPGLASELKRALHPLDIAVLGCYLNLAHPDEEVYQQTLARYIAHLRLASWLGGCVVGTETGNPNAEYRYDPETSHSDEALTLFIRRLRPVVDAAEKLGAILAIEPVYTHIVYDARRARQVLDRVASPNLQIILDPVNLLHPDNLHRRDEVLGEALVLIGQDAAVLHIKDYTVADGKLRSAPIGEGEMDYTAIFDYVAKHKPFMHMTLEDTRPQTAERERMHVAELIKKAAQNA